MSQHITYASLLREFGRGEIVKDAAPVKLVARLTIQKTIYKHRALGPSICAADLRRVQADVPGFDPSQLKDHEFDTKNAQEEKPSSDNMEFSFVLTTCGANENDQVFVEDELRIPEVLQSPVGQPLDWDHDQSFMAVCGEITNSSIFEANKDRPMGIRCSGSIFEDMYPEIAKKIRRGAGRWAAVSMEALPNPLEKIGKFLVIHNPIFVGAGLVRFPGNKFSVIEEVDGEATSASMKSKKWPVIFKAGMDYLLD